MEHETGVHGIARWTLFQCMTNGLSDSTSLNAEERQSDSRDNSAKCRLMILVRKRVRCELSGTTQQSFGQTTCHRTTWKLHRHHSNTLPLFRNHLTRSAVAMLPPPPNPVASTEHECRGSRLPAVPHIGDAEEKGKRVFWEEPGSSNVYSTHHDDPTVPKNLKMLLLMHQTQAVNDRITVKGCRHLLVKPWANGTEKGNSCQQCGATTSDKSISLEPAS